LIDPGGWLSSGGGEKQCAIKEREKTKAVFKSPLLVQSYKPKEGVLIPFRVDQIIRYGSCLFYN